MTNESLMALASLLDALATAESEVAAFFGSVGDDDFVRRPGEAWSPAEHLDHLNIAVSAVARGLGTSPLLLRIRFGSSRRQSRTYDDLRRDYQGRLAAGGRASGRYVPARSTAGPAEGADPKTDLLARWARVNGRLRAALSTWSERNLDRVQLPHPILGKITARELVYFTIYHGGHHVLAAKHRLDPGASYGAP